MNTNETLQFRLVDAFATAPFSGNPAGVVIDADSLDDAQMQAIAREINASETSFLFGANDLHRPPRLRWFTPGCEVGFCGHATIAAAHALYEWSATGAVKRSEFEFDTAAGPLKVHAETVAGRLLWWLAMPAPSLKPDNTNPMRTTELLGLTLDDLDPAVPIMRTRDDDIIILIRNWHRLTEMKPRFGDLAEWSERSNIRGLCVATTHALNSATHMHSRFFAPAAGINEDPVTGSVHGPLCALLVERGRVPMAGDRAALNCIQGVPGGRTGLVRALVEKASAGMRVSIAGECYTTVTGMLRAPVVQAR